MSIMNSPLHGAGRYQISQATKDELAVRADFEDYRGCAGQAHVYRSYSAGRIAEYVVCELLRSFDEMEIATAKDLGIRPEAPWLN